MKSTIFKLFVLLTLVFCQVKRAEAILPVYRTIANTPSTANKESVSIDFCLYFEKNNGSNYELSVDAFLGNHVADKDITISFDFSYELYAYGNHVARITDYISVTIPQGTNYLNKILTIPCLEIAEDMSDMRVANLVTSSSSTKYNYFCAFSGLEGGN